MAGRKVVVVTAVVALTLLLVSILTNKAFAAVTKKMVLRGNDGYGSGAFEASRDGGTRAHNGIDIIAKAGEQIFSPISGTITRLAYPYANDSRFKGLVIEGEGYLIKLFYILPTIAVGSVVTAGQAIATAQDLTVKYPGITNHIHFEVYHNGELLNPSILY